MERGRLSTWKLSGLSILKQYQGSFREGVTATFAVAVLKPEAWQAASLAPQRPQGALVMSSVKSHPQCAGKCKEEQQGPASLFCLQGKSGLAGQEGDGGLWDRCVAGREILLTWVMLLLGGGGDCGEEEP